MSQSCHNYTQEEEEGERRQLFFLFFHYVKYITHN
jgi:hypothetical protein